MPKPSIHEYGDSPSRERYIRPPGHGTEINPPPTELLLPQRPPQNELGNGVTTADLGHCPTSFSRRQVVAALTHCDVLQRCDEGPSVRTVDVVRVAFLHQTPSIIANRPRNWVGDPVADGGKPRTSVRSYGSAP